MSKKKKKEVAEGDSWVIEHFDQKTNDWKSSHLNAIKEERWAREAAVEYNHDLLTVPHDYEFCVDIITKAREQRKDAMNPLAYRFRNLVTEQIVSASILV